MTSTFFFTLRKNHNEMESGLKQPKTLCDHGALKILVNLPLRRLHRDFAQSLKKISLRAEKRRQSNVIRENHSCEGASCDSRGSHMSKRGLVMTDKKGLYSHFGGCATSNHYNTQEIEDKKGSR